jgi:hypothetical protein
MERLARLEIDGPIFHLDEHVRAERAVEQDELVVGLLGAIFGNLTRVNEGAPHDDASVRCHGIGEHVRPVGMGARVILRARLALRVRLHQKAPEIRNECVDLARFFGPPRAHLGGERIGRSEVAELDRRAEASRQVHANAVGAKRRREGGHFFEPLVREDDRVGVHVGEDGAVQPDRRARARVVEVTRRDEAGQLVPIPEREACVPALDRAIEVVPVVE